MVAASFAASAGRYGADAEMPAAVPMTIFRNARRCRFNAMICSSCPGGKLVPIIAAISRPSCAALLGIHGCGVAIPGGGRDAALAQFVFLHLAVLSRRQRVDRLDK